MELSLFSRGIVFDSQPQLIDRFRRGELHRNFVGVLCFQGPRPNGTPELHRMTPALGVLQDEAFRVALVTDGRVSGASGRVPAAIHVTPEALVGVAPARVRDGNLLRLGAESGRLELQVEAAIFVAREPGRPDLSGKSCGLGRKLFVAARAQASSAEQGATIFGWPAPPPPVPAPVAQAEAVL
jgi:phosphogluconate dehydratase